MPLQQIRSLPRPAILGALTLLVTGQPLGTFKLLFNQITEPGARAAAGSHD